MSDSKERARALYRPPFRYERGYIYDAENNIVADDPCGSPPDPALRVRGWGRISYLPEPEKLQGAVGEMIAEALTEYWQARAKQQAASGVAEDRRLRRALCITYAGSAAYMDDGEAQDNRALPCIDFLRDSVSEIIAKMGERNRAMLAAAPTPTVPADVMADAEWVANVIREACRENRNLSVTGVIPLAEAIAAARTAEKGTTT